MAPPGVVLQRGGAAGVVLLRVSVTECGATRMAPPGWWRRREWRRLGWRYQGWCCQGSRRWEMMLSGGGIAGGGTTGVALPGVAPQAGWRHWGVVPLEIGAARRMVPLVGEAARTNIAGGAAARG